MPVASRSGLHFLPFLCLFLLQCVFITLHYIGIVEGFHGARRIWCSASDHGSVTVEPKLRSLATRGSGRRVDTACQFRARQALLCAAGRCSMKGGSDVRTWCEHVYPVYTWQHRRVSSRTVLLCRRFHLVLTSDRLSPCNRRNATRCGMEHTVASSKRHSVDACSCVPL